MEPGCKGADRAAGDSAGNSGATGSTDGGGDPFVELKTIDILDAIRIRVPAIWPSAWDERARMWRCGGEDPEDRSLDTGTFWIDVSVIELGENAPAPGSPQAGQALDSMAQGIALEKMLTGAAGDDAPAMRVTPGGNVITYSKRFNDGGGELVEYRWHMLTLIEHGLAVAHYSLIQTNETAGRPAWKRLVETMDREIQAAAVRRPGSASPVEPAAGA
jgi:hypothetical protein